MHRAHASAALRISVFSVGWTVLASAASITLGITENSAVLVAFGAIGVVDAVGSLALVYHFHHSLRHDELSEELERLAHRVVLVGLFVVGAAAIAGGLVRLFTDASSDTTVAAVVLASVSVVVLTFLSVRKQTIARQVSSPALASDGQLSGVGAAQAVVALVGTVLTNALGLDWADALATAVLGCVAVALSLANVGWKRAP